MRAFAARTTAGAVLTLALGACASTPDAPDAVPPAPLAPRPFTADEIMRAMPVGTLIRLRMDNRGESTIEEWRVTDADATSCTIAAKVLSPDGALLEDQGQGTSTWAELRDHASFPASHTVRERSHVEVPAGAFDTWAYVVTAETEDGEPSVSTFHFAPALPGPPILMTVVIAGEEIARMTLLERTSP